MNISTKHHSELFKMAVETITTWAKVMLHAALLIVVFTVIPSIAFKWYHRNCKIQRERGVFFFWTKILIDPLHTSCDQRTGMLSVLAETRQRLKAFQHREGIVRSSSCNVTAASDRCAAVKCSEACFYGSGGAGGNSCCSSLHSKHTEQGCKSCK